MKLEGIRVLDLSMYLPGPHLTMMMADHGAEVIRIEPPAGEPTRALGCYHDDMTIWFRNTHRAKQSVVLDLKRPEAVEAFLRLAAQADVIVEAFRPGVVDRLGIGYGKVSEINPRIVYCSISAFGQTGPNAKRVAHDVSIEADAGVLSLNVDAQGNPVMPCVPTADVCGGMMGLAGVLMALLRREKTGRGDYVDISMQDGLVSWLVNVISPVFAEKRDLNPAEERSLGGNAFYRIYRCADGRSLTLGGSEIKFVENLLTALGRPDLIALCKLPPGSGQDPVKLFLVDTFAQQPLTYWESFLAKMDLCWAPVKGLKEALDGEHIKARGMRLEFADGQVHLGNPIKYSDEPAQVRPIAPALGKHTRPALKAIGYTDTELDDLMKIGAIGVSS